MGRGLATVPVILMPKSFQFAFIFLYLCFFGFGCGDEGFIDGGAAFAPPAEVSLAPIAPVPPDVADLLWGDVHGRVDELSLLLAKDDKLGDELHGARWQSMVKDIALNLNQRGHYTKYINAGGVAIIGGRHVDDRFFYAAQEIVLSMTSKRPEVRSLLTPNSGFRVILFHWGWGAASLPEVVPANISNLYFPSSGWCFEGDYCAVSVSFQSSEEKKNGLFFSSVFVHEFAHAMHYIIQGLDATFQARLEAAYANALEFGGFWTAGTYGYTDVYEYWAVGVTTWFDTVAHPTSSDVLKPLFLAKDAPLYALLEEWLPVIPVLHIQYKW